VTSYQCFIVAFDLAGANYRSVFLSWQYTVTFSVFFASEICDNNYAVKRRLAQSPTGIASGYFDWFANPEKKVAHTRLPSVGFRSWSRFLAVSLQMAWIINPSVGCHYFPPGLQLPPQRLRGLLPISLLGELVNRGTMGVNSLLKTDTRQRRGCDLNPGPSAPESSTLTTRLPATNPDATNDVSCIDLQH